MLLTHGEAAPEDNYNDDNVGRWAACAIQELASEGHEPTKSKFIQAGAGRALGTLGGSRAAIAALNELGL